jgi:hypothetical protein
LQTTGSDDPRGDLARPAERLLHLDDVDRVARVDAQQRRRDRPAEIEHRALAMAQARCERVDDALGRGRGDRVDVGAATRTSDENSETRWPRPRGRCASRSRR